MIAVTVEQKQGATTRQMKVSAPNIEQALQISGAGRPDTEVRIVFPIDAEESRTTPSKKTLNYTASTVSPCRITKKTISSRPFFAF